MLIFFHVFLSHQHVQMNTGPHEKKWCGKFFWGPFLNKIKFFDLIAVVEDTVPGKKKFHTIFFTHQDNFSALLRKNLRKKFKIGTPYYINYIQI